MLLFPPLFMTSCSDNTEDKTEKKTYPTTIDSISHSAPAIGDTVTVSGKNFGKERHGCYFVFETEDGNIEVEEEAYLKWSDTEVIFVVPESANDGNLFINNRVSSALVVEVEQGMFLDIINFLVRISLGITVIFIYLKINKIWKRKHEREVADSQSLVGLFIFILNCILWVIYYSVVTVDLNSMIDTSIYIFEGGIYFMIGSGIFVKGQSKEKLWALIQKALRLERKEADYLLKKWFKPANAEAIIHILHQIAVIDDEFDPKEQEIISIFAKEWNIDYDYSKMQSQWDVSDENQYMFLRKSVMDYLDGEPPREQVAQLNDMITTMIEADDKVTDEEALISSELIPMLENYVSSRNTNNEFHVLIVPQTDGQLSSLSELLPTAEKLIVNGGEAFDVGSYYSKKYAEMICEQYRDINYFTIVNVAETKK